MHLPYSFFMTTRGDTHYLDTPTCIVGAREPGCTLTAEERAATYKLILSAIPEHDPAYENWAERLRQAQNEIRPIGLRS